MQPIKFKKIFNAKPSIFGMAIAVGVLALAAEPAFASDVIFTGTSPIDVFIEFITGIFAYLMLIVGLIITLGGLVLGSDMSGFARRAPLFVVAGSVLILSDTVVSNLFSGSKGFEVPVRAQVEQHVEKTGQSGTFSVSAPVLPSGSGGER